MSRNTPLAIVPFVPAGKDFTRSRALFRALGFDEQWENGGFVGFSSGGAQFILQDFDHPAIAENMMVRIDVPNLDAWWAEAKAVLETFSGCRFRLPTVFPWGREVHFVDLAGVCWHVGEFIPPAVFHQEIPADEVR